MSGFKTRDVSRMSEEQTKLHDSNRVQVRGRRELVRSPVGQGEYSFKWNFFGTSVQARKAHHIACQGFK